MKHSEVNQKSKSNRENLCGYMYTEQTYEYAQHRLCPFPKGSFFLRNILKQLHSNLYGLLAIHHWCILGVFSTKMAETDSNFEYALNTLQNWHKRKGKYQQLQKVKSYKINMILKKEILDKSLSWSILNGITKMFL